MAVNPDFSFPPPTGMGRATLSNVLALLCLLVALLYPLGMLLNAGFILVRVGLAYPLAFAYNALDYFGLPVIVLAILLGHLSQLVATRLPSLPVKRWLARTGLLIGYLSLVFILGLLGFLA